MLNRLRVMVYRTPWTLIARTLHLDSMHIPHYIESTSLLLLLATSTGMSPVPQYILEQGDHQTPHLISVTLGNIKAQFTKLAELEKGYSCLNTPGRYTWKGAAKKENK